MDGMMVVGRMLFFSQSLTYSGRTAKVGVDDSRCFSEKCSTEYGRCTLECCGDTTGMLESSLLFGKTRWNVRACFFAHTKS